MSFAHDSVWLSWFDSLFEQMYFLDTEVAVGRVKPVHAESRSENWKQANFIIVLIQKCIITFLYLVHFTLLENDVFAIIVFFLFIDCFGVISEVWSLLWRVQDHGAWATASS